MTCSNRSHENRVARAEWMGSEQAQMGMVGIWSKRKQVMGADHVGIMRILSGGLLEIIRLKSSYPFHIGLCI